MALSRRTMLGAGLAAVLAPPSLAYGANEELYAARRLLLPGMFAIARSAPEFQFDMNVVESGLVVVGCRIGRPLKEAWGFPITREVIRDGLHKAEFAPNMDALIKTLREIA